MKRALALTVCIALGLSVASGAERREMSKVAVDEFMKDCTKQGGGSDGISMAMLLPVEFWQVALAASGQLPPETASEVVDTFDPYLVIACVRGELSPLGAAKFLDREKIAGSLSLFHRKGLDPAAGATRLTLEANPPPVLVGMLEMMKPMIASVAGPVGESFQFFVFSNRDADGKRIVSVTEKGTLRVALSAVGKVKAENFDYDLPFDSLFVPRECAKCVRRMHVSWNFCPWCGDRLPG